MSTPFSLAPDQLWQAINPITAYQQGAQFGFINLDLGAAGESDLERKLLDRVGSYGRQLGRIGDALEVILKHVKLGDLKPEEQEALAHQTPLRRRLDRKREGRSLFLLGHRQDA
jgi:hypothetical protein